MDLSLKRAKEGKENEKDSILEDISLKFSQLKEGHQRRQNVKIKEEKGERKTTIGEKQEEEMQERRRRNLEACVIPVPMMFVHLAKTGGTSLMRAFRETFQRELGRNAVHFWDIWDPKLWTKLFAKQTEDGKTPPLMIGGHLPAGFHRVDYRDQEENAAYSYMTILRHPVSRVWSHYTYHLRRKVDPNHPYTAGKTFEEWLQTMEFGRNAMTAYLSGAVAGGWWNAGTDIPFLAARPILTAEDAPDEYSRILHLQNPNPLYNVTISHFQLALRNLKRMMFVGLQEKMTESLRMLSAMVGVAIRATTTAVASRAAKRAVSLEKLTPEYIELIRRHNHFDLLLYQEAELLFEEQSRLLRSSCQGKQIADRNSHFFFS